MQTGGEFTVAIPRDRAFAFISDPFRIANCIPGCENLRQVDASTYAATLTNKVGPISVKFDVTVALTKVEPPTALDATVTGNAPAMGGRLTATATLRLAEESADATRVTFAVEMALGGRLGGIGQPVFRAKSDELSKKFGENVRAAIEREGATGVSWELLEPATLEDALGLLDPSDDGVRTISGGTALSLMLQARIFRPTRLVSLRKLNGAMRGIHVDDDGGLRIGALTTLTELERSPVLQVSEPVLAIALHTLSNVRVRNMATIGGHLAHGDPHMDLPPLLVTLDARVRVRSPRGERWIPMDELITGYYETSLAGDEIIVELHVPVQPAGSRAAYAKFTALSADDWPSVGVAAWLRREADEIVEARVVVGGATVHPTRMSDAEAALIGSSGTTAFGAAADAAAAVVDPIADVRGSRAYKREMVRVFTERALRRAVDAEER